MKFFNTSGIIDPNDHYCVPHRLNHEDLRNLIDTKRYFALHAPRQTGKTTEVIQFIQFLNQKGHYKALYVNVEAGQSAGADVEKGMATILEQFRMAIVRTFGKSDPGLRFFQKPIDYNGSSLQAFLQEWSMVSDKPIVLLIDEIDALLGHTLLSVLRQLRTGYSERPHAFPQSVCLVGLRDVRDYRFYSKEEKAVINGGSPFNIKAESLRLGDFSPKEVGDLYAQHTAETGQCFTPEAISYAFYLTQGQPWLVNALAYEACFKQVKDRTKTITKEAIDLAKQSIILRRDTHLDALIDRLKESRVQTIMEAVLIGEQASANIPTDDLQYVIDLGLLAKREGGLAIANPIYQEVIPRELTWVTQEMMGIDRLWYKNLDGTIDMVKLLTNFQQFYRDNADQFLANFDYKESGPHLLLMAFLQRIINGGGQLIREYALGRKRIDLLVLWPHPNPIQRIVIEIKVRKNDKTQAEGIVQTTDYMTHHQATEGHLVIFDRDSNKSWDERVWDRQQSNLHVWGV